ncbi:MAG: hypothetical protein RJA19_458 [Bacteroidota bacterium]|jgi:ferrous iron transport protein A
MEQPVKRLSELRPGEGGVIHHVDRPEMVQALIEMGCCIGEEVVIAHVAPRSGPIALWGAGRKIALRKEAAAEVWVEVSPDQEMI